VLVLLTISNVERRERETEKRNIWKREGKEKEGGVGVILNRIIMGTIRREF